MDERVRTRRAILTSAASGAVLFACTKTKSEDGEDPKAEAVVTPAEDLMQEHGVIERILLVYDEAARRLEGNAGLDLDQLVMAANIVRQFVEGYHEKNEEEFVFPRLEAHDKEAALTRVLRAQHERGREITAEIVRRATRGARDAELAGLLRGFSRMYRPHAAFEDTRAFPAFRALMTDVEYRALGDQFEDREHEKLGKDGFENAVAEIAKIESALGIGDLAAFTPPAPSAAAPSSSAERG
ncbi:MAG TPA: hemerythrin domain-containing protein [Polyangiaceae bacterium]|nr:hemerythrin domain-containing protein [Polyangiaceae bacterium]